MARVRRLFVVGFVWGKAEELRLGAVVGVFRKWKAGVTRNGTHLFESAGNGTGAFDEVGEAAIGQEGGKGFAGFAVLVCFVEAADGGEDTRDGAFVDLVEFQETIAECLGAYAEMAFDAQDERIGPIAASRAERIGDKENGVARKEKAGGEIFGKSAIGFSGFEDGFFAIVDEEVEICQFERNPEQLFFRCAVAIDDEECAAIVSIVEREAFGAMREFEKENSDSPVFQQGNIIEDDGIANPEERADGGGKGFCAIGGGAEGYGERDGGFAESTAKCFDAEVIEDLLFEEGNGFFGRERGCVGIEAGCAKDAAAGEGGEEFLFGGFEEFAKPRQERIRFGRLSGGRRRGGAARDAKKIVGGCSEGLADAAKGTEGWGSVSVFEGADLAGIHFRQRSQFDLAKTATDAQIPERGTDIGGLAPFPIGRETGLFGKTFLFSHAVEWDEKGGEKVVEVGEISGVRVRVEREDCRR